MTKRSKRGTPAGVSSREVDLWTRSPNARIRAGRAAQALLQQQTWHKSTMRDVLEAVAAWAGDLNSATTPDEVAAGVRSGAWLPQRPLGAPGEPAGGEGSAGAEPAADGPQGPAEGL